MFTKIIIKNDKFKFTMFVWLGVTDISIFIKVMELLPWKQGQKYDPRQTVGWKNL